ncbi:MAG: hypothetical protein U9R75_05235 [Candidatus Thermoplasmatota archaeon]|nr:hypothetical protein [Candidatus Thermoplasmatota archaeon]
MKVIFEKGLSNRFLGPGFIYLFSSTFFIILISGVMLLEPFPIPTKLYYVGAFLLIVSALLLFISLIMIMTTKPFGIFDLGIQYVSIQFVPGWNYRDHFIPYYRIESFIIFVHPVGDMLQIKDVKGRVYEIPMECVCKKVGREKWKREAPLNDMIHRWSGGKEVKVERKNTLRGERSIYEIGVPVKRKGKKEPEARRIPIIFKTLIILWIVLSSLLTSMFYIMLHDIGGSLFFRLGFILGVPVGISSISIIMSYFMLKKDRMFSHLFK